MPIGNLIKVLCCFIKAQSHITISILVRWQNITLETFMLGYKFYISCVWKREKKGEFGKRRIRTSVERIKSYFQALHALRPMATVDF